MTFKKTYTYSDFVITPTVLSDIEHRSECNPFIDGEKMLPIFTAPMDSVVDDTNYENYIKNGITPIIPRTVDFEKRKELLSNGIWVALSLNEFREIFVENEFVSDNIIRPLIDVANGHMLSMYKMTKEVKSKYNDRIEIMVGNIANPETYAEIVRNDYGVSYIRCSIGTGGCCITTSNVCVGYGPATLIDELNHVKGNLKWAGYDKSKFPKIIADGGMKNYSDIIKALALGADMVMVGTLFAQTIESSGVKFHKHIGTSKMLKIPMYNYDPNSFKFSGNHLYAKYSDEYVNKIMNIWRKSLDEIEDKESDEYKIKLKRSIDKEIDLRRDVNVGDVVVKMYGMASRDGQIAMNGSKTKTSEGITKFLDVKYTLKTWCENFVDYLRSTMSYVGKKNLNDFIGKVELTLCSESYRNSVNK